MKTINLLLSSLILGVAACGGNSDGGTDGDPDPIDEAPVCPLSGFEPNDTAATAAAVVPAECPGLLLSTEDRDWFRVDVPAHTLATMTIRFDDSVADLDLLAYDAAGTFLGARYMDESYDGYYRLNETDTETLSVLAGGAAARTYLFDVRGDEQAAATYQLSLRQTPFADGPDCSAISDVAASCSTLQMFPYPDPEDGFVGGGYDFDTSDWYYAFFVFSNYRWLQLKVIIAIRNAIHAVQQRFPGTRPMSLGDMSQWNGKTPGWDIGELRHPDGSHDDGLALDLAYYQTRASNELQWICDANLDVYTLADDDFCPPGLHHVVDLPRTAYFLMTLAQHPDFNVVGVDPVVKADLLTEARRQVEVEGWFAAATYTRLSSRVASGAGWEYHADHMHVWFD